MAADGAGALPKCRICGLEDVLLEAVFGRSLLACRACASEIDLALRPRWHRPIISREMDACLALFHVAASRFGVEGLQRVLEVLTPSMCGRLDAAILSAVELTRWAWRRGNAALCLRASEDGLRLLARRRALVATAAAVELLRDPWSNLVDVRRELLTALAEVAPVGDPLPPLVSTLRPYESASCS